MSIHCSNDTKLIIAKSEKYSTAPHRDMVRGKEFFAMAAASSWSKIFRVNAFVSFGPVGASLGSNRRAIFPPASPRGEQKSAPVQCCKYNKYHETPPSYHCCPYRCAVRRRTRASLLSPWSEGSRTFARRISRWNGLLSAGASLVGSSPRRVECAEVATRTCVSEYVCIVSFASRDSMVNTGHPSAVAVTFLVDTV